MKLVRVTTSGRVTIPAKLRKKYNLTPRRKVKFEIDGGGVRIVLIITPEEIKANAGFLGTKGKLLKSLLKEKQRER
jgi:bifunctional DNA-binding transcriptional regulator/antitoxin component of YhaV-PrlF toxin-antitoxin module